jgi:hypothetical protein
LDSADHRADFRDLADPPVQLNKFLPAATAFTTAGIASTKNSAKNAAGATDAGFYADCFNRTVFRAGSALHAGVKVGDVCFPFFNNKNFVRADGEADSATDALFLIQFERGDVFKIFHCRPPMMTPVIPATAAISWSGMAIFISFFTPDIEV